MKVSIVLVEGEAREVSERTKKLHFPGAIKDELSGISMNNLEAYGGEKLNGGISGNLETLMKGTGFCGSHAQTPF